MRTDGELELAFYERFLWGKGLEPYPVQEQAISAIFARKNLLVTVPTGTGKTLMAKAALFAAFERGERAVYTTPLRALTEEKYRELCADFPLTITSKCATPFPPLTTVKSFPPSGLITREGRRCLF